VSLASDLFEFAAERIEARTNLARLEARGTLRLALKSAGLEAGSVSFDEMRVVFERVLPGELETRGVHDAAGVCRAVLDEVAGSSWAQSAARGATAEEVFKRLGRD